MNGFTARACIGTFVAAAAIAILCTVSPAVHAQAPAASPIFAVGDAAQAASLIKQARDAEAGDQFDLALDRLYTLQLEQPRTPDALSGRLLLARLLTLVNDLPAAILQAQALTDELAPNQPDRQRALELATAVGRRLRSTPIQYKADSIVTKGLVELKDPTALVADKEGSFVLLDRDGKKLYRMANDEFVGIPVAQPEPGAVAALPDGTLVIAVNPDKNKEKVGMLASVAGKPIPTTGSWEGKPRPLKRVRSMAANSRGDVFIVDEEYGKGLLRCKAGATDCAPWGPPGELSLVKVGASDFVYTVDADQTMVRVLNNAGKEMMAVGPKIPADKAFAEPGAAAGVATTYALKKVVDLAIDQTYTLYLLDAGYKEIVVVPLRLEGDKLAGDVKGRVAISSDDKVQFSLKNPSAIAVTPSGTLYVTGASATRVVRFR